MRLTWDEFLILANRWILEESIICSTVYMYICRISQQILLSSKISASNQHYCLVKCVSDVQGLWSESIFEKRPCKALGVLLSGASRTLSAKFCPKLTRILGWTQALVCLSWPAPGSAKEWAQIENSSQKTNSLSTEKNETKRPNNHHHRHN